MTPEIEALALVFRDKLWTYRELSEATGINVKTIYCLLRKPDTTPHPRTLTRIQRFLAAERKGKKSRRSS